MTTCSNNKKIQITLFYFLLEDNVLIRYVLYYITFNNLFWHLFSVTPSTVTEQMYFWRSTYVTLLLQSLQFRPLCSTQFSVGADRLQKIINYHSSVTSKSAAGHYINLHCMVKFSNAYRHVPRCTLLLYTSHVHVFHIQVISIYFLIFLHACMRVMDRLDSEVIYSISQTRRHSIGLCSKHVIYSLSKVVNDMLSGLLTHHRLLSLNLFKGTTTNASN